MPSFADEILLDNGVILKGSVTGLVGDLLFLKSDYAEPIKVKTVKIIRIKTENQMDIHLKTGEILKGKLKLGDDGLLTIDESNGRGMVVVDLSSIAAINPPPVNQWKGSLNVAGNFQTGNSDRSALSLGVESVRKSDNDRFNMRLLYSIGEDNKIMTSRNAYGALKYDYFASKSIYEYLGVELLNDAFKDINLRTAVGPGVGYQIWDDPVKSLGIEVGISFMSEDMNVGSDKSWFTGRVAANYTHKISRMIKFTDNLILYPSIEELNNFTLHNEASVATDLGSGWALKISNVFDYDESPNADTENSDSNFMLGLQYSF